MNYASLCKPMVCGRIRRALTPVVKYGALLLVMIAAVPAAKASVVQYKSDNTTIFRNPERGYTEEINRKVTVSNPNAVKGNLSENWGKNYNMTMAVVLYNFRSFKSEDLPEEVLNGFDEDMQELRKYGLKCVLRFAYTESTNDKVDATPEWVKRHLEQLKPHLAANADVIYVIEAGFVGVWGEWYYSTNYGNETQHMNDNRRKVIDYLFDNVPEDRFILFRYPMIKTEYLNDSDPLTSDEAFTGTVKARMGCHNDAFLNDWGNDGTYASNNKSDDPKVRNYIATETLYVPNGGETNVESNTLAEKVYTKAPAEMSEYHWSFCGKSYATQVTSRWHSSGIFDTLNVYMGYRLNLLDAQLSDSAAPEGKMNVTIRLRNTGYAPMYNERKAYLVLRGVEQSSEQYTLPLTADPRRWLPNGVISAINEQVEIPAGASEGTYHLYLWLPDSYESIASDPRYAVRLANADTWCAETGYNDLLATVVISGDASPDPGELPVPELDALPLTQAENTVRPQKMLQDGTVRILMPDGRKYSILGQSGK